jgi:peptide/nickel transport system substrate-binding protein
MTALSSSTRPSPVNWFPVLQKAGRSSDDGLTFTFKMKAGLTFSSGNPVRAEDAAFSLQRAVKINKTPAFILNQFGWTAENVDQMVTADGDNVIIKTDKAYAPTFLYNCLTSGVASIVDKETVMANEKDGDMGNEWLKDQLGRDRGLCTQVLQAQ